MLCGHLCVVSLRVYRKANEKCHVTEHGHPELLQAVKLYTVKYMMYLQYAGVYHQVQFSQLIGSVILFVKHTADRLKNKQTNKQTKKLTLN